MATCLDQFLSNLQWLKNHNFHMQLCLSPSVWMASTQMERNPFIIVKYKDLLREKIDEEQFRVYKITLIINKFVEDFFLFL